MLQLATSGGTTVPTTGTTATYGVYPMLCGTNTGYHCKISICMFAVLVNQVLLSAYMDLSTTSADEATISFTIGDSTSNQYKIKVSQYSCDDPHISAQAGCFQYFVGQSGTIESYNLANTAQLSTLDYNNCIRQELGYCCIEYSVSTFTLGPHSCDTTANRCAGALDCSADYIIIPEVTTGAQTYDR